MEAQMSAACMFVSAMNPHHQTATRELSTRPDNEYPPWAISGWVGQDEHLGQSTRGRAGEDQRAERTGHQHEDQDQDELGDVGQSCQRVQLDFRCRTHRTRTGTLGRLPDLPDPHRRRLPLTLPIRTDTRTDDAVFTRQPRPPAARRHPRVTRFAGPTRGPHLRAIRRPSTARATHDASQ